MIKAFQRIIYVEMMLLYHTFHMCCYYNQNQNQMKNLHWVVLEMLLVPSNMLSQAVHHQATLPQHLQVLDLAAELLQFPLEGTILIEHLIVHLRGIHKDLGDECAVAFDVVHVAFLKILVFYPFFDVFAGEVMNAGQVVWNKSDKVLLPQLN